MPESRRAKVAFLLRDFQIGGVERTLMALAGEVARRGYSVDFLTVERRGPLAGEMPTEVTVAELGSVSRWAMLPRLLRLPREDRRVWLAAALRGDLPRIVRSLPRLIHYLERERPRALMTTMPSNNLAALLAGHAAAVPTRIVIGEANTARDLVSTRPFESRLPLLMRHWYPRADAIVAVSEGVREDLCRLLDLPAERVVTIHNPVDGERARRLAASPVDDPWLGPGGPPVVLAVGRLVPQKDFPTLLRAVARLCRERPLRLLVLGDGPEKPALQALAAELGIAAHVRLPGTVANPFPYMAAAGVLVLSSAWEGLGNVLIEAMACGCPVVATDCRSGPREILQDGAFGPLVPVGDPATLAEAIAATLESTPDRERLRRRAEAFALPAITDRFLPILLG